LFKIAMIGDVSTLNGFTAAGVIRFPTSTSAEKLSQRMRLVESREYAIIFITETQAEPILGHIANLSSGSVRPTMTVGRSTEAILPAIVTIPDQGGARGIGFRKVQVAVEKALGTDMLGVYGIREAKATMAGRIIKVSGSLVIAEGLDIPMIGEVVKVGHLGLFAEIISLKDDTASIQVYEQTEGIGPGEPVVNTGEQLSVELGPGLIGQIYDGIQRPLPVIARKYGDFITHGIEEPVLSRVAKWKFVPTARSGEQVAEGNRLGDVDETEIVRHRIMVPPGTSGTLKELSSGSYAVIEVIGKIEEEEKTRELKLSHKWLVRGGRLYRRRLYSNVP
jgi:vacuolar-type H+-ATPase subunit F/Vma7